MDNIIIYNTEDGQSNVRLYAKDGTVWMTQAQMLNYFNAPVPMSIYIFKPFTAKESL